MRKKRYGKTFLTEEEVRVLEALLKHGKVSDVAKVLGKAQPTVSIVKKRIEEKIGMALETVLLALRKGLIDKETFLELINTITNYRELEGKKAREVMTVEGESSRGEVEVIRKVREALRQHIAGLLNVLDVMSQSKYGVGIIELFLNDPRKFVELTRSLYSSETTIHVIARYFICSVLDSPRKQELEEELLRTLFEDPEKFRKRLQKLLYRKGHDQHN